MKIEVPLSDTVTAGDAFNTDGAGYIVGSPPVWKDGSDATYASYVGQFFGPGNPQFTGLAQSAVDPSVTPFDQGIEVRVRFRLAAVEGTAVKMPTIRFERSSTIRLRWDPTPGDLAPTSQTWVEKTLVEQAGGAFTYFLAHPNEFTLIFNAPSYDTAVGETVPSGNQRYNITEAHVYLYVPMTEAPPCRMWARDDAQALGGARNFPPARSQQRSSRGVGYY